MSNPGLPLLSLLFAQGPLIETDMLEVVLDLVIIDLALRS